MQVFFTLKSLRYCGNRTGSKAFNPLLRTNSSTLITSCLHQLHKIIMEPCVPLPLKDEVLAELTQNAKDWSLLHGVGMRPANDTNKDTSQLLSFLLLPSTFPKREFLKGKVAQVCLNEIIHKAAHNYDFLKQSLSGTIEVDPFTAELFRIYETVRKEGIAQSLSLGIIRSDYLLHGKSDAFEDLCLQQVEQNTIASSFGCLTTEMAAMSRFVLRELGIEDADNHIPENNSTFGLAEGIIFAWKAYSCSNAFVLFVIEEQNWNVFDQRKLEFTIRQLNSSVRILRKTLQYIASNGKLKDKRLFIDGLEIAVVYYRTGYSPDDYKSRQDWDTRLMIERSKAIKCPSIHYHLAGTKKVQQELNRKGVLESLLSDPKKVDLVRSLFTGLYSLDMGEEGDVIIEKAIENPYNYVLKPQREGGGNNYYKDDLRQMLKKIGKSEKRTGYILMDYISSPSVPNYFIAQGKQPELCNVVGELGIFGVVMGSNNEIVYNKEVGHLLRSKKITTNEGGIAAGFAGLDSPFLV